MTEEREREGDGGERKGKREDFNIVSNYELNYANNLASIDPVHGIVHQHSLH